MQTRLQRRSAIPNSGSTPPLAPTRTQKTQSHEQAKQCSKHTGNPDVRPGWTEQGTDRLFTLGFAHLLPHIIAVMRSTSDDVAALAASSAPIGRRAGARGQRNSQRRNQRTAARFGRAATQQKCPHSPKRCATQSPREHSHASAPICPATSCPPRGWIAHLRGMQRALLRGRAHGHKCAKRDRSHRGRIFDQPPEL